LGIEGYRNIGIEGILSINFKIQIGSLSVRSTDIDFKELAVFLG
jgi:hypothetical protein